MRHGVPVDRILWAELYRILERVEGHVGRLGQHVDATGHDQFEHLQGDIRRCVALVQDLMSGTPGSAAYMRLVGWSDGE